MRKLSRSTLAMMIVFTLAMPHLAYGEEQEQSRPYFYYEYQNPWYTILEELNPKDYARLYCKDEQLHIIPTKPEKVQAFLDSLNLNELEKKNIIMDDATYLYSMADLMQAREKLKAEEVTYKIWGIPIDIHNNRLIVALEEFPTKPGMAEIWRDDFCRITGMDNIALMTIEEYRAAGYGYREDNEGLITRYIIAMDIDTPQNGKIACSKGYEADFDAYFRGKDIMIPLRTLIVALNTTNDEDYTIEWVEGKNQINLKLHNRKVMLDLDKNTLHIGNVTVPFYNTPAIKDGRVYISVEDMSQILKLRRNQFSWDKSTNSLTFDYNPLSPNSCPWEF